MNDGNAIVPGRAAPGKAQTADPSRALENLARVLCSPDWRRQVTGGRGNMPSIVTYLGQFMAHDVTRTEQADTRFGTMAPGTPVNLRSRPLMLQTLYGEGMHMDAQLHHEIATGRGPRAELALARFRPGPDRPPIITLAFSRAVYGAREQGELVPVLADPRNAAQPVTMMVATEFAALHNRLAATARARASQAEIYIEARIRTTLAWHNVLRRDFLARLCPPPAPGDPNLPIGVTDTDFLHGLLRAFHGFVLPRYRFPDRPGMPLRDMLHRHAVRPRIDPRHGERAVARALALWARVWMPDWADFDGPAPANVTGARPVYPDGFGDRSILLRDLVSARRLDVSPISAYPALLAATGALLAEIREFAGAATPLPQPDELPLSLGFLAEAHARPDRSGRLGPLGAALMRRKLRARLTIARRQLNRMADTVQIAEWEAAGPQRFLDIAQQERDMIS